MPPPHEPVLDANFSHPKELLTNGNGNGSGNGKPHPPFLFTSTAPTFTLTLKFEEVVYKVKTGSGKEKTILNGVTGMVCPGEMLAMLGPSGSGKTTLLTALGGRLAGNRLSGKIIYNGQPFAATSRRRIGFVAQYDILYPHLTVAETLMFTALLRLPSSLTRAEKAQHARRVAAELGLDKVTDSLVGGPRVRGISGGEKRRVSIGQEMLLNPSLLLLDEPTSGLDSTTAQKIVGTLRRLAADGRRAVVVTIHQPSTRLYQMFDKVILLSEGCPIYHGRGADALGYFGSIGFGSTGTVNPAELLLDLANGIAPSCKQPGEDREKGDEDGERSAVRDQLISAYDRNIAGRLKVELCGVDAGAGGFSCNPWSSGARKPAKDDERWGTSWAEQFTVLLHRSIKERRHETFNKLRIFQVLSVATLGGLLWWQTPPSHIEDRTALIFFFSVFWGFFPLYNAVFTFPQERPMLLKEQASGMYRLSSYFMARTVGDLPMELALPTAFTLILYWMGGLDPRPDRFLLSLAVVLYSVLVAQSLGLAFGAFLMDVKQATTLASVTTLTFLIAGGFYVQHIPPFILWLKYLSYSFYCFKLLVGVQFRPDETYECSRAGGRCPVMEFPAIKSVGVHLLWVDAVVMGFMLVGYRLLAYWALHRLQKPR